MSDQTVLLGHVDVDSGQLMILDPCYLKHLDIDTYRHISELTSTAQQGGALPHNTGHEGLAVAFQSGVGDGFYAVYATLGDVPGFGTRVKKVEIVFIDDDPQSGVDA